jgi:MYXO-CTERM domain-containing protein
MKKLIAVGALATMVAASSAYAQGWITAVNNTATAVTASETAAQVYGIAVGAAIPKSTSGLKGQVYYATSETGAFNSLGAAADIGTSAAGRFNLGNLEIPGVGVGADVWLQIRVWEGAYGSDYTSALNASASGGRFAIVGVSSTLKVATGSALQPTVLSAAGLQGFSVSVVPEPGTIALGALGLAGLFLLRRRN